MPVRTVGRITRRKAFAELQRSRARGASGPVRVTFVPAETDETGVFPQVAYAIGRHCGNAVVRNSLRRRAARSYATRPRVCPGVPTLCGSSRPQPPRTLPRTAATWRLPS